MPMGRGNERSHLTTRGRWRSSQCCSDFLGNWRSVNVAVERPLFQGVAKGVAMFLSERRSLVGKIGELPQSAVEKMLGGHLSHHVVVSPHLGDPKFRVAQHFDQRQPHGLEHFGRLRTYRAGDNAVAAPVLQPFRRQGIQRPGLELHRPGAILQSIARNAFNHPPAVGQGSLDEQQNVGDAARFFHID